MRSMFTNGVSLVVASGAEALESSNATRLLHLKMGHSSDIVNSKGPRQSGTAL